MPAKKSSTKKTVRVGHWYKSDDNKAHYKRKQKQPKQSTLRKSIQPGTVLILLSGRFRGKRVVFLKQLESGLLLITGPYKINGVPLRRVSAAYTISTKTKVNLAGIDVSSINDTHFKKNTTKKFSKVHTTFLN